jgi:hypothetical protein
MEWDHIQEIVLILRNCLMLAIETLALQDQPTIGLWCAVLRVAIDKHLAIADSDIAPFLEPLKRSSEINLLKNGIRK